MTKTDDLTIPEHNKIMGTFGIPNANFWSYVSCKNPCKVYIQVSSIIHIIFIGNVAVKDKEKKFKIKKKSDYLK